MADRKAQSGQKYFRGEPLAEDVLGEVEVVTEAVKAHEKRHAARFLKGPIPLPQLAAAARLRGACLAVLLAVHHRQALTKHLVVTLPRQLMTDFGIDKDAKARALRALEDAGLVEVERRRGRPARVSLPR